MNTRCLAFLLMLCATAAASAQPASRPNIIFIMSDDHAAHAISAYGSRVNWTPNLDQWELFDLDADPLELHNLYGQAGQEALTATLKTELQRLKRAVRDDDQFANEQLPNGVDGPVATLRGK